MRPPTVLAAVLALGLLAPACGAGTVTGQEVLGHEPAATAGDDAAVPGATTTATTATGGSSAAAQTAGGSDGPAPAPVTGGGTTVPPADTTPTGDAYATAPSCTPDTWAGYAGPLFAARCASCHGQTEFGTIDRVGGNAAKIAARIASGNMPPGGFAEPDRTRAATYVGCVKKNP